MSKAKAQGTYFETRTVNYLLGRGLRAERKPLSGSKDIGDIWVQIGDDDHFVIEAKADKSMSLAQWTRELQAELKHSGKKLGAVVIRRKRGPMSTGSIDSAYALLDLQTLADILIELRDLRAERQK